MSGSGVLLLFLVSSIVFLLMGLALVLFVMQYQKRMMKQAQELKTQEVVHQETLLKATIDSQEEERQRIAGNLHDGLGAQLSTIRLQVLMHGQDHPDSLGFSESTAELLAEGIRLVREISHDLLPGALKSYGLNSAWKELFRQLTDTAGLTATIQSNGDAQRLPEDQELALYRITQELVNNTLKHARAQNIQLHVDWSSDKLLLTYSDDGIGFSEADAKGLGTYTIQSRIQSLGGTATSQSQPGNGMQCTIEVPLITTPNT